MLGQDPGDGALGGPMPGHHQAHAQLTGGPNFAYDLCCDRIPEDRLRELDLSSLSVCYCGSEPIRLKTVRRFLERFSSADLDPASFYPCYGLAENTLFPTLSDLVHNEKYMLRVTGLNIIAVWERFGGEK